MKKFEFTIHGNRYEVHLKSMEGNIAEIEVNGTMYEVELHREIKESKTPKLIRKPNIPRAGEGQIRKTDGTGAHPIKAPLPGSISAIRVKAGDEVKKGDVLLIMEAMKMENKVLSDKEGIIKRVAVSTGQAVLQNDILVEIE